MSEECPQVPSLLCAWNIFESCPPLIFRDFVPGSTEKALIIANLLINQAVRGATIIPIAFLKRANKLTVKTPNISILVAGSFSSTFLTVFSILSYQDQATTNDRD